eukprot:scaffold130237_cov75-Phaeocystis_antarctica.AAC.6
MTADWSSSRWERSRRRGQRRSAAFRLAKGVSGRWLAGDGGASGVRTRAAGVRASGWRLSSSMKSTHLIAPRSPA